MNVVNKIRLPVDKPQIRTSVSIVKDNPNSRQLQISVTNGGKIISLKDVKIAAIRGIKPDGTRFYNTCAIIGDEIIYNITSQSVAVEGTVICEIDLISYLGSVTSAKFNLEVTDKIFGDGFIESQNEYGVIQKIIRVCEENAKEAADSKTNAQNYAEAAKASAVDAFNQANSAKEYAQAAQAAAKDAYTSHNKLREYLSKFDVSKCNENYVPTTDGQGDWAWRENKSNVDINNIKISEDELIETINKVIN
ncbi:MAG: low specificity L-threonine aldolase [Lachnospiraceae bacterium]|nr:low specificity L-threonine aldolase [Lachnospiraceae bacterium]